MRSPLLLLVLLAVVSGCPYPDSIRERGDWVTVERASSNRLLISERLAEVEPDESAEPCQILLAERPIEPEIGPQPLDLADGRALAEHLRDRVAGHDMDQGKDERDEKPDDRYGQKQPT
jgi:hypothetical protein